VTFEHVIIDSLEKLKRGKVHLLVPPIPMT